MHQGVKEGRRKAQSSGSEDMVSLVDEAIELGCNRAWIEEGVPHHASIEDARCREILNALKPLIDGNEFIVVEPYGLDYIDLDRDGLHWFARVSNEPGKWAEVNVEDRRVELFPEDELYDRLREALGGGLIIVRRDRVIQVYYDERPGGVILKIEEYPPD